MKSDVARQQARAQRFAALHDKMLVLPNAWDAASAALFAATGAQAIATTSGGCAWSRGCADGNEMTRSQAIDAIATIVHAVDIPVTADIESGYADNADELDQTIEAVLNAGAVGINIEDCDQHTLRDVDVQCKRIAVARERAERFGVDLFINARIDTYLLGGLDASASLREVTARARAYVDAGASGVFVPGLLDSTALRDLVAATSAPINVMVGTGAPSISELAEIGVRRVSVGTSFAQLAYGYAQRAAQALLQLDGYPALDGLVSYAELNTILSHGAMEES